MRIITFTKRKLTVCATFALAIFFTHAAFANDDWTRFRGPNGAGVSAATNLPTEFGPEKNVVWKTPLPPGHSSPVLTRDRIFVTAHTPTTKKEKYKYQLLVIALDRKTGKILWQREVPRTNQGRLENANGPASASPVTDGTNVYVFFQDFGLLAYTKDGKERWRLPLGPFNIAFGFGASPTLVDDKVILPVDQDSVSYLLAVDKNTGRVKWKVERPGVISGYSTPLLYQPDKATKQLIIAESYQLSAYAVEDGKRAWFVRGLACEMKSVPALGDGVLYVNGWGMPENQPGMQLYLPAFAEAIAKFDADKDGKMSPAEMPHAKLKTQGYFSIFDSDQDGRLNQTEWEQCRAMFAAENGLLAITLGGKGDMTDKAIRWRYQKPVPQVPSTLLYQGALFMVNDSGILISFDPTTGNVIKQGRLKGAIDKYFASPIAADGNVWLVSQDGTVSVVKAQGEWEVVAVNSLGDECFATPAAADGKLYFRTQSMLYCFGK